MSTFPALTIYRLAGLPDLATAETCLQGVRFTPCGPTQEKSSGWVPPRGEANGAMVEAVGGHWITQFCIETRSVPGEALRREVDARAARIEHETGRSPGRKERKALREDALVALLPSAFPRRLLVNVWIDPGTGWLGVASVNRTRVDDVVTALIQALPPGASVAAIHTAQEPAVAMAEWLATQEPPAGFTIDRECELKARDESRAVVRYGRHPLDIDEVRKHIEAGKVPTRLAVTWEDRASFTLTAGLQLRGIQFLAGAVDDQDEGDAFDARAAIAKGELAQVVPAVLNGLGGEAELP